MYELFYGNGGHYGPISGSSEAIREAKNKLLGSRSEKTIHIKERSETGFLDYLTVKKLSDGTIEVQGVAN